MRDDAAFHSWLELLVEGNRAWCKHASTFIMVIAKKTFDFNGQPSRTHAFDAGAACENLALEGTRRGFVIHAMEGFDYEKAKEILKIPDDHEVMCMVAVGKRGEVDLLPKKIRKAEKPTSRKSLAKIVFKETFGNPL